MDLWGASSHSGSQTYLRKGRIGRTELVGGRLQCGFALSYLSLPCMLSLVNGHSEALNLAVVGVPWEFALCSLSAKTQVTRCSLVTGERPPDILDKLSNPVSIKSTIRAAILLIRYGTENKAPFQFVAIGGSGKPAT